MINKTKLKEKAIALRKKGVTYGGIMDKVPVAKSTLALWFKELKLSKPQFQRVTKARLAAGRRGGEARRSQRLKKMQSIIEESEKEIGQISERELWLIGTTLYWAEGTKEKDWVPGSGASFINMDPFMIQTFLKWLSYCGIKDEDFWFELYIHDNHKKRLAEIKRYWMQVTDSDITRFNRIYWKKPNKKTQRKRIGSNYFGILKIDVKQSSTLVRKIAVSIHTSQNLLVFKRFLSSQFQILLEPSIGVVPLQRKND